MKLRILSWWLDVTIALYLRANAAYVAALPRRAGDDELIRDTIRREGLMQ